MQDWLWLGVNVFYQEWMDQQVELCCDLLDWQSSYIVNVGKLKFYGVEFELVYVVIDMLDLIVLVGLLYIKFIDFCVGLDDFIGLFFLLVLKSNILLGFVWGDVIGFFVNGYILV